MITIIVFLNNSKNDIENFIKTLSNQTYKDLELICLTKEKTFIEKIDKFKKFIDIKVIENKNLLFAKNEAIKNAQGKYVVFLKSDDKLSKNYLKSLYDVLEANNCDIAISKNNNKKNKKINRIVYSNLREKFCVCDLLNKEIIYGKLFKKDIIKDLYFSENTKIGDFLWLKDIFEKSSTLVEVFNCDYAPKKKINKSILKENYFAKKFILDYFSKNNFEIKNKDKTILKDIKYLFKIPILKIIEKDFYNTWYLFSFLPILKYKDFDSHYIFEFFKIKLSMRHKTNFLYVEPCYFGLTKEKRKKKIIVSLTSHPKRIDIVHYSINTLLNQTIKPDKIILYLAQSQFLNKENDLPVNLLKLRKLGLEIRWCEDLRSYKKIIPALKEFPNDIIITADDDIYYSRTWLEDLYRAYLKNPKNIYVKRAIRTEINNNQIIFQDICNNPSYKNQLMSGSGCLFPPFSLYKDIYDIEKIKSLIPTHDDIYLWIMAILANIKICVVDGYKKEMLMIDGCEKTSLSKNENNKKDKNAHSTIKIMLKEYPEVLEKLKNEDN